MGKIENRVLIRRFVITSGAERYAYEVTWRLAENHDVHVLCNEWDPRLMFCMTGAFRFMKSMG